MPKLASQKITPCLWFESQAEEAAKFYVSLFDDSRITKVVRFGEGAPGPAGGVMTVTFQLAGQEFTALNGGPAFNFTEAVSFVVHCDSQREVDEYWQKLSAGGQEGQCGWLKDRYGLSWQVVPTALYDMLATGDAAKLQRVMGALMQMRKLDAAEMQRAFDGR